MSRPRRRIPAAQRRALIGSCAAEVFAERGYDGSSVDEIARRSGVSAPVLYDHFPSKLALYRQVLDTEYAQLRETWHRGVTGHGPMQQRVAGAIDAWFAHVERRRTAIPLLFQVSTADHDARQAQVDVTAASRAEVLPLVAGVLRETGDTTEAEMLVEIMGASLRALALWWYDHPTTPRSHLVTTTMDALWPGLERRLR
ncbi:TetR/AcrR family transcriptional regulator [Actinocrispum wychmicini]|uniref:TetR family transcriptional regulator n=1 Tax=Actinocrispum wychmicini TaxID=1213861 RepID=A0A4R2K2B6_9PSEU|nr:TetR/AcrR family transcriptional regulator [Actinocrispum wychmicini]TCO65862.1 TetR family transcriptional regulator [Actinocrispum wychmicini]